MARFKKGDKVRILDGLNIRNYTGGWVSSMNKYVDKVATIDTAENFSYGRTGYRMKETVNTWDERGLELVNPETPETIIIYRKDNKVIALDKSTGEKSIARCNPADTFDFMTGAKLAFDRLADAEKRFKVGDIVRGKYGSSAYYGITNDNMTRGEVVGASSDGKCIDVKIMDYKGRLFINRTFYKLNSKYFELVEEANSQE